MSSSPASLGPCHIQPHTIRQGWAEIEDKQAGGLGTNEEGRKVAGTWEKTKHRQGGPYLKTGSTQWGPAREKTLRELIAPSPHQFVFLLEMWVHGRTPFCGAGAALHVVRHPGLKTLSLSLCPEFVSNLTPPRLCLLLFLSGQDSHRSVSKHVFSCSWWRSPQAPPKGYMR